MNKYTRSPILYMGNKYKLLPQILNYFPQRIVNFYDVFGGSGVMSLNVKADVINYNELNPNIYNMFKLFNTYKAHDIIDCVNNRVEQFDLKRGGKKGDSQEYRKSATESYLKFRKYYNDSSVRSYIDLYTLSFFSFSNLIRFNQNDKFNMPIGNQYFNKTHIENIKIACSKIGNLSLNLTNIDALNLLKRQFNKEDFVYLDPPYLNTTAVYNEKRAYGGWTIEDDYKLFEILDILTKNGIKWAMSNVYVHKGKTNQHLIDWSKKYNVKLLFKKYCALGKGNAHTQEVLIMNYQNDVQYSLFENYN